MTVSHKRPAPRKNGSAAEQPGNASEQTAAATRPAHYPEYLYGLHERGGERAMIDAGRRGWVLELAAIGLDGNSTPADFSDLAGAGLGVIVRINHGYGSAGTLPTPDRYGDFAAACARYVQRSRGCRIWIIGNEPNHEVERPNGRPILPHDYARAYSLCRTAIRAVQGHEHDEVLVAGPAPWNATTTYPGNEKGDWVRYFVHVMTLLADDGCDGFALHTYTHDLDPRQITGDFFHTTPGYRHLRNEFRTYRDFMNVIPDRFRHLPVFITETDPTTRGRGWHPGQNVGWVQAAYREIANWNQGAQRQPILSLILYRWPLVPDQPEWSISNRPGIIEDFRQALASDKAADFKVRMPSKQTPPVVLKPGNVLPVEKQWQGLVVATLGLNLRSGPSTGHAVLQILPNETALLVLAELDEWLYVQALGRVGYVHAGFVLRQSPGSGPSQPARTYLREHSDLLKTQLAPTPEALLPISKEAPWTEQAVAATWNQFGALVNRLAAILEIDPAIAIGVLAVESGGNAFAQDGRMTIRFESHIFFEEWGKQDPERFAQHFRFDLKNPWRGHQWRPDPNSEWREFHGDQNAEWAVFEFARTQLNGPAALRSISMGVPQIMGFNHDDVGFLAPEAMFNEFASSAQAQVIAFFDFVNADPARLAALRKGDFLPFATSYNGEGQAPLYAMLIQDAVQAFHRLRATAAAPAREPDARDAASQLPAPAPAPTMAESDPELYAAWRDHILEGFDHNREMFDRLLDAFIGPYQTTVWMYRILFGVGLTAFVTAAVAGIWTGEAMISAVFGGLGVVAFVSYFLSHPLRALEENLNYITWLGVIYNSYWTRLVYAMNQETIQQDMAGMTDDFVDQIERLIDKHAQTSQNRPGLR